MSIDIHPLAQDDYHLIQEYMASRILALLVTSTSTRDWEHEVATEIGLSNGQWERRNGFLFDFTLGRFLHSARSARNAQHGRDAAGRDFETANERFTDRFLSAIDRQDASAAEAVWEEFNNLPYWPDVPAIALISTRAIITRLQIIVAVVHPGSIGFQLPEEYDPPVFVS
jgi:hypothetical protein